MYAAAGGHSNLGIPKDVGEEFVRADAAAGGLKPELGEISDMEAAESIRDGELPSPTTYGDFWLFDLRITGTGAAFRDSLDEWAIRDPKVWLSDEFVNRCNGLAVIDGHPERSGLNSEEYRQRSVGQIVLPYIKGDEVWGIAKIFDADMAKMMTQTHRSTSPGVTPPKGSLPVELNDGTKVLDEGLPLILDHLAICEAGVWDKDGPPLGIRLDAQTRKEASVTEEEKKAVEAERDDAKRRADAAEAERDDFKKKNDEMVADKARRDAEETDREQLAAAAKGKADARKDWETKKDSESDEEFEKRQDSRMDGESDEDFEDRKKDRKSKKDAAAKQAEIDANRGTELNDSRTVAELKQIVENQGRQITALSQPASLEDSNALAATFHRADAIFQMLGETTPQPMAGEKPIAYRRRVAARLQPFTDGWKGYVFHDSQQTQDFDLVENAIYAEAVAHSKKAIIDKPGFLREIRGKTSLGREQVSFIGDHRAAWLFMMPPTKRYIVGFNREPHRAASR